LPGFLDIGGAEKRFGAAAVLQGIDLAVAKGEFVSLLGPSGCGKTTLLRIVAGLLAPDRGRIVLDGADIAKLPPHKRDVGVVFQNYALFPHLSVADNVAFGLRAHGRKPTETDATVAKFLDLVRMGEFAKRPVQMLSGGQQQRVAVARALAVGPKLMLFDEPFSALDRKLRETMQIELRRLLRELGTTAIFVTHDQDEALVMSDRIAIMNRGAIEQLAAPAAIYETPATAFALDFVGLSTRLEGKVAASANGTIEIDTRAGRLLGTGAYLVGARVTVGVRPERVRVGGALEAGENGVEIPLRDAVYLGAKLMLHFDLPEPDRAIAEVNAAGFVLPGPGAPTLLRWRMEDTLVFPEAPVP
jgi:putative spermidine/putrescine transport system ATP-binding protein